MYDTFLYALRAILPILLIIATGFAVRRVGPWDSAFFKALNKLGFRVFMPLNLFINVYGIEDLSQVNWKLTGAVLAGIFLSLFVGVLAGRLLPRSQRGVMAQASFRSNQAILGLPLVQTLGGDAAMAFASVILGISVPLYNVLAVIVLVIYSGNREKRPSLRSMLRQIVTNPLIIGAAFGILVVGLRQSGLVPAWFLRDKMPSVYKMIVDLAKVASPIMLFVLGTGLDFRATGHLLPQITLGLILRLVVSPVLVIGAVLLLRDPLGLTAVELPTFVTAFATPVAASSAVMVQEIGGDDQLASQLVVWSSAASMVTIFAIVFVLRTMGAL